MPAPVEGRTTPPSTSPRSPLRNHRWCQRSVATSRGLSPVVRQLAGCLHPCRRYNAAEPLDRGIGRLGRQQTGQPPRDPPTLLAVSGPRWAQKRCPLWCRVVARGAQYGAVRLPSYRAGLHQSAPKMPRDRRSSARGRACRNSKHVADLWTQVLMRQGPSAFALGPFRRARPAGFEPATLGSEDDAES